MFQWFDAFFSTCNSLGGCRVDYLSTHIYACSADYVMNTLQDLYNAYQRPIWLTELACPGTSDPAVISAFMKEVIPRLEQSPIVERYAWFASRFTTQAWGNWLLSSENSLLSPHVSQRSALGDVYVGF